MAGPPLASTAVLSWHFTGAAVPRGAVTTLGFIHFGWDSQDWQDFAVAISDECKDLHQLVAVNDCILSRVELKQGPVDTGPTFSVGLQTEGSQGVAADAPNVAYMVNKHVAGLSGRFAGRMFYPGVSEGNTTTGGVVGPAAVSQINSALEIFYDAAVLLGGQPCVFGAPGTPGAAGREVTALTVDPLVATQRRRLRR